MKQYETSRLVTAADLNHHGTLFAARAAAWFVEAGFLAAGRTCGTTEGVVCRCLNGMEFHKPVLNGLLLRFLARAVFFGNSSFIIHVRAENALTEEVHIEGMLTFVTIEPETGKKRAHHMRLDETADEEELLWRAAAERIRK